MCVGWPHAGSVVGGRVGVCREKAAGFCRSISHSAKLANELNTPVAAPPAACLEDAQFIDRQKPAPVIRVVGRLVANSP